MAVVRIWKVMGQLKHSLDYAANPEKTDGTKYSRDDLDELKDVMDYAANEEKTEKKFYVSGVNCNASIAREQFINVKKQFGKEGGIIAYHAYQSFAEGEVTPELAHKIGVEFAQRVWGKDYQVLVATHLNTKCLHNHFVINSISFQHGKRLRAKQWYELKNISDEICKEYGISIVESKGKGLPYKLALEERSGNLTRLNLAREAINTAISHSCNLQELAIRLKEMGYICQFRYDRKYWTIRQKDWERPIRLVRLGEAYGKECIAERLKENEASVYSQRIPFNVRKQKRYHLPTREDKIKKIGGLKGLYLHYCYKLGYLPKYQQSAKRVHYLYRDDLVKMKQISEEAEFLIRHNISTEEALKKYKLHVNLKLDERTVHRTTLRNLVRHKEKTEEERQELRCEIAKLSEEIKVLRKELRMCDSIAIRSEKMAEKMEQEKVEMEQEKRKERSR